MKGAKVGKFLYGEVTLLGGLPFISILLLNLHVAQ